MSDEKTLPEERRCYKAADGEWVEVVAVCRVVGATDGDAEPDADGNYPLPVVIAYRTHGSDHLALHEADWHARGFVPITRGEFVGDEGGRVGAGFALVLLDKRAKVRECRDSRDVAIVKALTAYPWTGTVTEVEFFHGARRLRREPVDGRTHDFREDARRAKRAFCATNGIKIAGWRDHYPDSD